MNTTNSWIARAGLVASLLVAALLGGCGGGGASDTAPPPAPSAEGAWSGLTSTSRVVSGLVLGDGSYYLLYTAAGNPSIIGGFIQGTGSTLSGSFTSSNAVDFNVEGLGVSAATLASSFTAKTSLNGAISYTGGATTTFTSTYDASYENTPLPLATIANTFTGTVAVPGVANQTYTLAASATGVISGSGNGCTISGTIAPRTAGNAYDVSLAFTGTCALAGSSYTGVADYTSATKLLVVIATNAPRSSGLIFLGTGAAVACSGTWPVTHVTASIAAPTTWTACNVYAIDTSISVNSTLTIEPGTAVKFATGVAGGANMTVSASGTIIANGTATDRIVFTSMKDDSVGGDSNGDGATTPLVGDWGKIVLNASGSTFDYANFYYGGATDSTVQIGGNFANSATISNSTFAHNNGGGVADSWGPIGALDAGSAKAATVITGNTFYDNNVPLTVSGVYSVDNSNTFHDPANIAVTNTYNGIFHMGHSSKPITGLITYAETEVPLVLAGYINVPAGSALTLADNVVVKFMPGNNTLSADGTIVANATVGNKIVFTSFKDDAHGGDTNGDGAISSPAVGDWSNVTVNANGSVFNHAEFYYGGFDTANRGTLKIYRAVATVTNSLFVSNHGGDIATPGGSEKGVLNAYEAKAGTIITGNTFYSNSLPMSMSGLFDVDDSNVFHDPANPTVKNTYNAIFFYGNSANSFGTVTLSETEVPFAIKGSISIPSGMTLTLGNNVAFKMYDALTQLWFTGSVVNATGPGVVFTSLKDDTVKGDSNGDGAASAPANTDWYGIRDAAGNWAVYPNAYYHLF